MNHILFFLFLIALPVYVFFTTKKIKASSDPKVKEKTYYKIFVIYWVTVAAFWLLSSLSLDVKAISLNFVWTILAYLAVAYILLFQAAPLLLLSFNEKYKEMVAASFDKKSYVFPTTARQRYLFIAVPITVGICEEIIFRGYLFQYLQAPPYGLSAVASFLLVVLIFGLGHFAQGISGIVESLILGYLLGYIYLVTGSLVLPIIIHILYDFKILYISKVLSKHQPSS